MGRYYLKNGSEVKDLREARKVNGKPSVTTVINAVCPHSFKYLESVQLKEAFIEADGDWEYAVELLGQNLVFEQGSLIHEAAELYLESQVKSDPLENPLSASQMFKLLGRYEKPVVEKFYYSTKMDTGGRIDVTGKIGDKLIMSDYKSCMKFKKKATESWLAQLGAYALILEENGVFIDKAEIIQYSKKNEGCRLITLRKGDLDLGKEIFIKARELFRLWKAI